MQRTASMKRIVVTALGLALAGCGVATGIRPDGHEATQVAGQGHVTAPAIAAEVRSPNQDDRPGGEISAIILHHTAVLQDAQSTARFFQDPKSRVSAHYVVDRSGSIIRCVADAKRAWHAGVSSLNGRTGVNDFSVGIEICNVGDGVEPYPQPQVDAVVRLVAWLAVTHHVPLANLTRHRDVAQPLGRKTDTSDNFDQAFVRKAVQDLIAGRTMAPYHVGTVPAGYDPSRQQYVVRAGDTYASIAEDHYDSPAMAGAIARLNSSQALVPGAAIRLPVGY